MREALVIAAGVIGMKYFFNIDVTGGLLTSFFSNMLPPSTSPTSPTGQGDGAVTGSGNSSNPDNQGGVATVPGGGGTGGATGTGEIGNLESVKGKVLQSQLNQGNANPMFNYHAWAWLFREQGYGIEIPTPEDAGAGNGMQDMSVDEFMGYLRARGLSGANSRGLGSFTVAESMRQWTSPTAATPMERLRVRRVQ